MASSAQEMEERWGFLRPLVAVLRNKFIYTWGTPKCTLGLHLPRQRDAETMDIVREALALLGALASVDYAAWRYVVTSQCGVVLGERGSEEAEPDTPVQVMLRTRSDEDEEFFGTHLVELCGARQRTHASQQYRDALVRIVDGQPRVDFQSPLRVLFRAGSMRVLKEIGAAFNTIKEEWQVYEQNSRATALERGGLPCSTLTLAPMIINLNDEMLRSDITNAIETLARESASVLEVKALLLNVKPDRWGNELANRKMVAQVMASGFGSSWGLRFVWMLYKQSARCVAFEAMASALFFARTLREVRLELDIDPSDNAKNEHMWKWLGSALFSKQTCSSVEHLILGQIQRLNCGDALALIDAMDSVCPYCEPCHDGRNAFLKGGAQIVVKFLHFDLPQGGYPIRLLEPTRVQTFDDDQESAWVDILVPGYGHCQALRDQLTFTQVTTAEPRQLKSLSMYFYPDADCTGLPQVLAAVGPSLESLHTGARVMEINEILRRCPNLTYLSLLRWNETHTIDAQIDLSDYHTNEQAVPALAWPAEDVVRFSRDLSDSNNPLSSCVRRLRVDVRHDQGFRVEPVRINALLHMLEVNQRLEYFEVTVFPEDRGYVDAFRRHHLQPIHRPRPLSLKCKLAFLSVVQHVEKATYALAQREIGLYDFDENVLSKILALAAPPVLRQVYFLSRRMQR